VDQYQDIRHMYLVEGMSQRTIAKQFSLLQVLTLKRKLPLFAVFRRTVSYARFSFHCGMGIVAQSREVKEKAPHRYLLWFLGWILGFGLYLLDKIKLRKFKKKRCETG